MRGLAPVVGLLAFGLKLRIQPVSEDGTLPGTSPGWGTPVPGGPSGSGTPATVTVDPGTTLGRFGADFTGFSSEKTHIMNGSLTSNKHESDCALQASWFSDAAAGSQRC